MKYIQVPEAMKRLGKSDRQIRRMVHSGKLAHDYAPDGKLLISVSDIDKAIRQSRPPQEIERLDAIERELIQLRERLDTLSSQVDTFIIPREKAPLRSLQPQIEGQTLPPDLTPISDLIKQYGLERQRKAIYRHMQPWIKQGHWKREGHEVKNCLDAQGIEEFQRRYVTLV